MNRSKIVAGLVFLFTMLVPFRMLFITDEGITHFSQLMMMLGTIVGFFVGFGIGTNEPFDRKPQAVKPDQREKNEHVRKAA